MDDEHEMAAQFESLTLRVLSIYERDYVFKLVTVKITKLKQIQVQLFPVHVFGVPTVR